MDVTVEEEGAKCDVDVLSEGRFRHRGGSASGLEG